MISNLDLTKEEDRIKAIEEVNNSFISQLKDNGVELSNDVVCDVGRGSVIIGIKNTDVRSKRRIEIASEIEIYSDESRMGNGLSAGSSGAFNPTNKASYWRTIHAASILTNWGFVCEVVNTHCKMYSDLVELIYSVNKV